MTVNRLGSMSAGVAARWGDVGGPRPYLGARLKCPGRPGAGPVATTGLRTRLTCIRR